MTLDIRDLARDWQELLDDAAALDEEGGDESDQLASLVEETQKYVDLCNQVGCEATPDALERWGDDYDPTLIPDDEFVEHAEDEARSIYDIPDHWPFNCIDWERAAHELSYDYTSITYDGDDYYIRSF